MGEQTELGVRVAAEGADVEEVAELTRQLRRTLLGAGRRPGGAGAGRQGASGQQSG